MWNMFYIFDVTLILIKNIVVVMEYFKEYRGIDFKVSYSLNRFQPERMCFAAQPYERMLDQESKEDTKNYLVYGMVEKGETLQVGFKGFSINMTESFHSRLGLLYDAILKEYSKVVKKEGREVFVRDDNAAIHGEAIIVQRFGK